MAAQILSAFSVNAKGLLVYTGLPKNSKTLTVKDHNNTVYNDGVQSITLKEQVVEGLTNKGLATA